MSFQYEFKEIKGLWDLGEFKRLEEMIRIWNRLHPEMKVRLVRE